MTLLSLWQQQKMGHAKQLGFENSGFGLCPPAQPGATVDHEERDGNERGQNLTHFCSPCITSIHPPIVVTIQGPQVTPAGSSLLLFLCSVPSWAALHQDESGPLHQRHQQVGQSRG